MTYEIHGHFVHIRSLWLPKGTWETFLDDCTEQGEKYDKILTDLIREYLEKKGK